MTIQKARFTSIDSLRGWLIVCVMLGHLVLGSVHDNFIRYSIYAFHMPVFIGLTGFLINSDSLRRNSLVETITRYWWRVIFPFGFAYLFFTGILLFHAYEEGRISSKLILSFIHTPYYHLWFIPTMVIWVITFSFILKLRIPRLYVLLIFMLASLAWAAVPKSELMPLLASILSKKVVYFFSFFLFGAWLRTSNSKKIRSVFSDFKVLPVALILGCSILYCLNIGIEKSLMRALVWLVLNVALITLLIDTASANAQPKQTIISEIGRNSLPIYLWHVVPLFLLKGFGFHHTQPLVYYCVAIISLALIVWAILRVEAKSKWLDRCLFGVVR